MKKITGYLRLMRPANIVTSIADVLAGSAICGFLGSPLFDGNDLSQILILCLSTACLYGGGVVFNDVFDADLDKIERPERPIPSGLISLKSAASLGIILLIIGITTAGFINTTSLFLAIAITASALIYDKWGKHHNYLGPLNMGLCRGLNLLLGMSIISNSIADWWFIALMPIIYIAAITMISRGEVHGGKSSTLYFALVLFILVTVSILYFSYTKGAALVTLAFLIPFCLMIFPPLQKAIKQPIGPNIGKAVKASLIALIMMNAAWASASGAPYAAIAILALLPVSIGLAKTFAVT